MCGHSCRLRCSRRKRRLFKCAYLMMERPAENTIAPSRISVVIPCYNHGAYLAEAIRSIQSQSYPDIEIIVVDDGSTDYTKEVAWRFEKVRYVHQSNQGLSAARNNGIKHCTGAYIIFSDADDWLLPGALQISYDLLHQHPDAAFVSGGHIKVNEFGNVLEEVAWPVTEQHYQHLLQGNYIGMHGTVLYRAWAFEKVQFDTTLRACEDYDVYLKLARLYPVLHHTHIVAAYRIHTQNMSGNIPLMLESALGVLQRQQSFLQNNAERKSYATGLQVWKDYYTRKLFQKLIVPGGSSTLQQQEAATLLKYDKSLYIKHLKRAVKMKTKKLIKKSLPPALADWMHNRGLYKSYKPATGAINLGSLNRTKPFSTQFGYDRGGPVDRYYIENFLEKNKSRIRGRALEIGDNEYTLRFGGNAVTQSDILHIDDSNKQATFIGDLSNAPQLPNDAFDCIVLTQTLHLIYNYKDALATCFRILKPGGTLLLTVPGISHIDQGEWKDIWLWAFTQASIKRLLAEVFPTEHTTVDTFGNVLAATAFLYGMGLPEVKKAQLDETDPHYQVIITACAQKLRA